jgi:hypothetical protein
MLRLGFEPSDPEILFLTSRADAVDTEIDALGTEMKFRYEAFRSFLRGHDNKKSPLSRGWNCAVLGDVGFFGEICELEGFSSLWNGDYDRARGFFDTAATHYYLDGCPQGGLAMEWASNNLDELRQKGKRWTLFIPPHLSL